MFLITVNPCLSPQSRLSLRVALNFEISPVRTGGLFELHCFSGGLFKLRVKGYTNFH